MSAVSARKIETVLATLLVRAGQVVSVEQLVTEIWGNTPPRRATATLHVYISQVRKFLAQLVGSDSLIVTRFPGYLFELGSDELDLHLFQRLVIEGRGRLRARQYENAAETFDTALGLWRGPALNDLRDGPIINSFATWMDEIRLECIEMMTSAGLMLGRHHELTGMLHGYVAEHPLNETFCQHLMLALYRSGRRADALKVFHTTRDALRGELGLEPCRALQSLQHAILTADDSLDDRRALVPSLPEAVPTIAD